jgi:hypothetical protein
MNPNFFTNGWSWNSLNCDGLVRPRDSSVGQIFRNLFLPTGTVATPTTGGSQVGSNSNPVIAGATESDQAARQALAASCQPGSTCFTYTSTGNCSNQNNGACTSLDGVQQGAINQMIALQRDCGCTINITGGTETGHGGSGTNVHTQGAAIDFNKNSQVNTIIQSYGTPTTVNANGVASPAYKASNGVLYIDEGSHWHMQLPTR